MSESVSGSRLRERPEVAAAGEWAFPSAEAWQVGNGISGHHVEMPGCGLIDVAVHVDAPLSGEPGGREGLTDVLARCLGEGVSAERDAAEFAAAMDEVGATFDAEVTAGGPQLKVGVPATGAPAALALVAELLRAPRFEAADVERMVANNLDAHAEMTANSAACARAELYATAFAPGSRLSLPRAGTPASVSEIGHRDVAGYWGAVAGPRRIRIVSAGDLPAEAIREQVAVGFDAGSSVATDPETVPEPIGAPPRVRLVHRPGAVQTAVAVGGPTVSRQHPDHAAVAVAAYVLGVPINSRLSLRLREEKGYTYGVRAALRPELRGGLFTVATQVERDVTAPALTDLVEILETFRGSGMSAEEHGTAVEGLLGKDPIAFQTPDRLVSQLAEQEAYRLPAGWLTEHRRQIAESTYDGCNEAFNAHVPANLSLVLVGDAEVVEPALTAEGWTVEVVS
ncbi:M16 family metallopeptidase [Nocardioides hungaricus]